MKRTIFFLFFIVLFTNYAFSTEKDSLKISGTPLFLIFTNFHQGVTKASYESNFDVPRAFLGYDFDLKNGFRASIKLDIGSPDSTSQYSLIKRSAYFRNAEIGYSYKKLYVAVGIIDNLQHKIQERFWGKRYIYKTFVVEHDFISSTDLGITATYKFSENFSLEAGMTSGELLNKENGMKKYVYSIGANYSPVKNLNMKLYSVYTGKDNDIFTGGAFIGYKIFPRLKIGADANIKADFMDEDTYIAYGYSIYSEYMINTKFNIFARYDALRSNTPGNHINPWNLDNDGSAIIAGIEYKINKNVRLSLNYQDWYPASSEPYNAYIFLNLEFGIFDSYKRI